MYNTHNIRYLNNIGNELVNDIDFKDDSLSIYIIHYTFLLSISIKLRRYNVYMTL